MEAYCRESPYLRTHPVTAAMVRETMTETLHTTLFGLRTCNSDVLIWGFMKSYYQSIGLNLQFCSDGHSVHFVSCTYHIKHLFIFYFATSYTVVKWQ